MKESLKNLTRRIQPLPSDDLRLINSSFCGPLWRSVAYIWVVLQSLNNMLLLTANGYVISGSCRWFHGVVIWCGCFKNLVALQAVPGPSPAF